MAPDLEWSGPAGAARRARLFAARPCDQPGRAALIVGDEQERACELALRLADAGCTTLLPAGDLLSAQLSDREACAELEAALSALAAVQPVDPGSLALIGLGRPGTQAFLCACTSRQVAAVVVVCATLVHAELDAQHPVQPLDMALNLTAPVLLLHAEQDAHPAPDEVRATAARLERALRSVEVEQLPGRALDYLGQGAPGYDPAQAARAGERIVAFLRSELDPS